MRLGRRVTHATRRERGLNECEDSFDSLQQLFRPVGRGVEVTLNSLFTNALERQDRAGTILTEGTDQLLLVRERDGMSENKEIKAARLTVSDGLGEAERRLDGVASLLQKHLTGRQQTPVIRNRKNAFGHKAVVQEPARYIRRSHDPVKSRIAPGNSPFSESEWLLSSPIKAKKNVVCVDPGTHSCPEMGYTARQFRNARIQRI